MIYLDYNATAPLRPEALAAMQGVVSEVGNPSSLHGGGRQARRRLDEARDAVLGLVGAKNAELVFTASGTEADNLAIMGQARQRLQQKGTRTLLVSAIEHPAVVAAAERLAGEGMQVRTCPVAADGRLDLVALDDLLDADVALLALMLANNETGILQPVREACAQAARVGVPVHVDAVQAAGKIPIDFEDLGAATLALSGHKFGGPRGIGALVVRSGVDIPSLWFGGVQEGGVRPGTPATLLAVGLAAAADTAQRDFDSGHRLGELRDRLERGLMQVAVAQPLVRDMPRLPNTASVSFDGIPSHILVDRLSDAGLMTSGGAACHAGQVEPSSVLLAMAVPPERAGEVLRLSLGPATTGAEVDEALEIIDRVVSDMLAGP